MFVIETGQLQLGLLLTAETGSFFLALPLPAARGLESMTCDLANGQPIGKSGPKVMDSCGASAA